MQIVDQMRPALPSTRNIYLVEFAHTPQLKNAGQRVVNLHQRTLEGCEDGRGRRLIFPFAALVDQVYEPLLAADRWNVMDQQSIFGLVVPTNCIEKAPTFGVDQLRDGIASRRPDERAQRLHVQTLS